MEPTMSIGSVFDVAPFMRWPGFPLPHPGELERRLRALVAEAAAGPCQKSKRGAMFLSKAACAIGTNGPPCGGVCAGDDACRFACASICNHAEMRALIRALLKPRRHKLSNMHVLHVAVDVDGNPRSKPRPSCITCSRDMLEAGVEVVWLWGAPEPATAFGWWAHDDERRALLAKRGIAGVALSEPPSVEAPCWRAWPIHEFHAATLENCRLPRNVAVDQLAGTAVASRTTAGFGDKNAG